MGRGPLISTLRRLLLQLWCSLASLTPILLFLVPVFSILFYLERCFSPSSNWIPLLFTVWATIKYGRHRRNVLLEEMSKKRRWLMENTQPLTPLEPCEWLNKLLMNTWPNYMEPKLSHKFATMMMKKFKASKPKFVESAELEEFSLGLAPPAVGLDCTYWTTEENEQVLHTGFDWDTNEMSILIAITLARPFKKRVLVGITNLHIKGDLRVVPILDGRHVLYSFEAAPKVQIGVTFGGDSESSSSRMMEIPGISFLLERIMLSMLVKNMVEPQRSCFSFPIVDLQKHISGAILSVTVLKVNNCSSKHSSSFTNIKEESVMKTGNKNRFVEVKLDEVVRRTQCSMKSNLSPSWDETFDMILDGSTGSIYFKVLEQSSGHSELLSVGHCKVKVKYIQDDSTIFWANGRNNSSVAVSSKHPGEFVEMTVPLEGNSCAEIHIRLAVKHWHFAADDKSEVSHGILGSLSSFKATTGRTIKVVVEEGRNLVAKDKDGNCDPYILLQYGKTVRKTKTIRRNMNPSWNQTFEFAEISGGEYLKIKCFDADWIIDETLGTARVNLGGLEDDDCRDLWVPLESMNTGEIRLTIEAIQSKSSLESCKNATSANGILELVLLEARDLVAADLRGTSDPFVSVHYGNLKKRTKVIYKNLNPQWNQTLEFLDDGKLLELHVKDHNILLPTSNIGHCTVEYKDLPPNQTLDTWIPLLGVKRGEVHIQITRRFHAPQKAPKTQRVTTKSVLTETSLKISSCLREAFQLAEDDETEQLREKIAEMESLENDQEVRILQVLREKEMLLSKVSELERVMLIAKSTDIN